MGMTSEARAQVLFCFSIQVTSSIPASSALLVPESIYHVFKSYQTALPRSATQPGSGAPWLAEDPTDPRPPGALPSEPTPGPTPGPTAVRRQPIGAEGGSYLLLRPKATTATNHQQPQQQQLQQQPHHPHQCSRFCQQLVNLSIVNQRAP